MASKFYQKIILQNPKSIFIFLIFFLLSFGYYSKDFRLDASSETLLIDGDPDLEYLKKISDSISMKVIDIRFFDNDIYELRRFN